MFEDHQIPVILTDYFASNEQENEEAKIPRRMDGEVQQGKRLLGVNENQKNGAKKLLQFLVDGVDTTLTLGGILMASELRSLIPDLGRDNAINCLIRCSKADYGAIACLNRYFYSLIKSGNLYKLRRQHGIIEHWIYLSCHLNQWQAFDPKRCCWMRLPKLECNECLMFADKESLAVGNELLVFGRGFKYLMIYRYNFLTNSWTKGMNTMNQSRCLFGSASLGPIGILAGGCDSRKNTLDSAELYDSDTGTWRLLPSMNKPRRLCSGFFMDGKFYVIGGIGGGNAQPTLTCGEEYDLEAKTWTEIPNMCPIHASEATSTTGAPPLVAVVKNQLYAADHVDMVVRKFDKVNKEWITIGPLPKKVISIYGLGLAFVGCGDLLVVIGGPQNAGEEGFIEVNAWVPNDGPLEWKLLGTMRCSGSFVYNTAIMGS